MAAADTLAALAAQATASTSAMDSATIILNGLGARVQAAVDAALANGATAEQMAPVQAEVNALGTSTAALATAVAANTSADPNSPAARNSNRRS